MHEVSRVTELAASIVAAHASRTDLESSSLPGIIADVSSALIMIDGEKDPVGRPASEAIVEDALPAGVSDAVEDRTFVRNGIRTVYDRHIVCLEDNKSVVLLARHLKRSGIAVADYLRKWDLPDDYPMVAPGYAAEKRALALNAGLGKAVRPPAPGSASEPASAPEASRRRGTLHPSYGAVTSPAG